MKKVEMGSMVIGMAAAWLGNDLLHMGEALLTNNVWLWNLLFCMVDIGFIFVGYLLLPSENAVEGA